MCNGADWYTHIRTRDMSSCLHSMHGYASDSFHYMPSQIIVHIVTCVSRVGLYHKIGQIFIISMVLFIKRNELCIFFSVLILLINNMFVIYTNILITIICKNIYLSSIHIILVDQWTVSLKKLVMRCPEATARPLQRISPQLLDGICSFGWKRSEQTDSSNDPINGFSQYEKSLETLFTIHTYFIIIVK